MGVNRLAETFLGKELSLSPASGGCSLVAEQRGCSFAAEIGVRT